MFNDLIQQKKEIASELSQILQQAKADQTKDKAVKQYHFEQAIKKTSQLYYLHLFQINNLARLSNATKKEIQEAILKEFAENIVIITKIYQ